MDENLIGIWSGMIRRALDERGRLTVEELKRATGLESDSVYAAIGWLAREGTIRFHDDNEFSVHIYHEHYY